MGRDTRWAGRQVRNGLDTASTFVHSTARQMRFRAMNLAYNMNPRLTLGRSFLRNGGILAHEGRPLRTGNNSHLVAMHVGQTNAQLRARSLGVGPGGRRGPSRVSTFESTPEANFFISRTLDQNSSSITSWILSNPPSQQITPNFRLTVPGNFPSGSITGRIFRRSTGAFSTGSGIVLALERTYGNTFTIVTGYPRP